MPPTSPPLCLRPSAHVPSAGALAPALQAAAARGLARIDPALAGRFCLFASSWWRQNYAGGPWRWLDILTALGLGHDDQRLARPWTSRGLAHLGRPLIRRGGRRLYLESLAVEAGLPLQVVAKDGSALREVLRDALVARTAGGLMSEDDVLDTVAEDGRLPARLRHDPVLLATAALIEALAPRLRQVHEAGAADAPLRFLDDAAPGWREQLPLALDSDTLRDFLNGLVDDSAAARQRYTPRGHGLRVVTRLDTAGRLLRSLHTPRSLADETLRQVAVGLPEDYRPWRATVQGADADGTVLGALYRDDGASDAEARPWRCSSGPALIDTPDGLALELIAHHTPAVPLAIPGAGPLGELPWTFRPDDDGGATLVATGSARLRATQLLLALPDGWPAPDGAPEPHRCCGRPVYALCTPYVAERDGVTVRITPASDTDDGDDATQLVGALHPSLAARLPVYRGWPRAYARSASGTARGLTLQVRSAKRGWIDAGQHFGRFMVRGVERDGTVRFQHPVAVVPDDLQVTLSPATGPAAAVTLHAAALRGVESEQATLRDGLGPGFTLQVAGAPGAKPTPVAARLRFRGGAKLQVRLPSPIAWTGFLGRDGAPVPDGARHHIADVGAFTAVDVHPSPRHAYLHARLLGEDVADGRVAPHVQRTLALEGVDGLGTRASLRPHHATLQRLLALSADLDARLRLELMVPGQRHRATLDVYRYDRTLTPERERGTVRADPPLEAGAHGPVVVEARPLDAVDEAVVLEIELPGHRWHAPSHDPTARPWLITLRVGSWYRGRPLLWTTGGAAPATEGALRAAIRSDAAQRPRLLQQALDALADDLFAPDWAYAEALLEAAAALPAGTLDPVKLLLGHRCLPLALLRASWLAPRDRLRRHQSLERTPLCWAALPLRWWFDAFDVFHRAMEAEREPDDPPDHALQELTDAVTALPTPCCGALLLEAWRARREPGLERRHTQRWPPPVVDEALEEARQGVRQRHPADAIELWPPAPDAAPGPRHRMDDVLDRPRQAVAHATGSDRAPDRADLLAWCAARDFDPQGFDRLATIHLACALMPDEAGGGAQKGGLRS